MYYDEKIRVFQLHLREEERSPNTICKYTRDVREFYKWYEYHKFELNESKYIWSKHGNSDITKEVLIRYKDHLKNTYDKISTINSKISFLNSYFTYTVNITLRIKIIKCQKNLFGNAERELTEEDFRKMLKVCNERLRLLMETIACTGIRVSEVRFITIEALKNGRAIVNNKGKTRNIIIPKAVIKKLLNYSKTKGILSGPIFVTRSGNPIGRKQIWRMMKSLAKKVNVSESKIFPHNLRHMFAKEFYKQTKDIVKLASILGHGNMETTHIYTMNTEEECRKVIESINLVYYA